ncbi:MAG: oxidoreductase [Acidobacteria bacterium]|nr:oxidoreductase [Acidobacteriota bacterium]
MRTRNLTMFSMLCLAACGTGGGPEKEAASPARGATFTGAAGEVKLITLDPGHFHAALVQKTMYPQVDPKVHVFAPAGPDVEGHLARIEAYNTRAEDPTSWEELVYTGDDFLEKMLAEKPGNVVVISGNNARKAEYIKQSVAAGLNVLADKPMVIQSADYPVLKEAYRIAAEGGVLIDDIMTERFEITSILQKRLSEVPELFGELTAGTPDEPAISKQSVHHFSKIVSGRPLIRPAWFFDVRQQGEGIVDVTTHLVDLIQWQAFPGQALDFDRDVEVLSARRWPTRLTLDQFAHVTGLEEFPDYLKDDVGLDGVLEVYANGGIVYRVKGIHAKVSVEWHYEAPEGAGDTHYSIMKGSKAHLSVRQGEAEGYTPTLYVDPAEGADAPAVEKALQETVSTLSEHYPGLEVASAPSGWVLIIPDEYRVGHEAHFAQVTEQYFRYLVEGRVPPVEVQNLLTKYAITTRAWEMSRP